MVTSAVYRRMLNKYFANIALETAAYPPVSPRFSLFNCSHWLPLERSLTPRRGD